MTIDKRTLRQWREIVDDSSPGPWTPAVMGDENGRRFSIEESIKAIVEATKISHEVTGNTDVHFVSCDNGNIAVCGNGRKSEVNARFVVMARDALPRLLDEVESLDHRRVYVAGPLTRGDQLLNIRKAIDVGDHIQSIGYNAFIPHLSCQWHMTHAHGYEWWMKWCLSWLETCAAIVRIPGESSGADREVARARELGIPVVESTDGDEYLDVLSDALAPRDEVIELVFEGQDPAFECLQAHGGSMSINDDGNYVVRF